MEFLDPEDDNDQEEDKGKGEQHFDAQVEADLVKGHKDGQQSPTTVGRPKRKIVPSSFRKSPWIDTQKKTRGKKKYDDKHILFQLCNSCRNEEPAE